MIYAEAAQACKNGAVVTITAGPNAGFSGKATRILVLFGLDYIEIEGGASTRNAPISEVERA